MVCSCASTFITFLHSILLRGMSTAGTGSPCGACKFLRRKCTSDCIFAPHFCSEQGPARFAAIHKIFGASNVAKLLSRVPVSDWSEAVVTIAYEAQARLRDPVYGCVAHIFALQQQVAGLQAQLMQVKAQVAQNLVSLENQWAGPRLNVASDVPNLPNYDINCFSTHQSSLESIGHINDATGLLNIKNSRDEFCSHLPCSRIRASQSDELGELQELAFRMMKD